MTVCPRLDQGLISQHPVVFSSRVKAAAKRAGLEAKADILRRQHDLQLKLERDKIRREMQQRQMELEQKEIELKMKMELENLQLESEICAAQAEENT